MEEKEALKEKSHEKKGTGAAIGYNYNDPGSQPSCSIGRFSFKFLKKKQLVSSMKRMATNLGFGKWNYHSKVVILWSLVWTILWFKYYITGPVNDPNMEPKDSDDDSDLEIIDVDLSLDVNKMEAQQVGIYSYGGFPQQDLWHVRSDRGTPSTRTVATQLQNIKYTTQSWYPVFNCGSIS